MTDATPYKDRLVEHLVDLAQREDRATLAQLRGTLQEGRAVEGLRVVLPYIVRDARWPTRAEDDGVLLAGLFALHPESGSLSLATALRIVARESDSVELRFRALLSASRADLPTHLRHAVTLVASRRHAIDWANLHTSIRFWDHPSDRTRRDWARDFWAPDNAADDTSASTPSTAATAH